MITIYGKPTCVWCEKAKRLAAQYGFEYNYIDVEYKTNLEEMKSRIPDAKTIPQIWWDDRYLGGYDGLAEEISNTVGGYGEGKI